MIALLQTTPHVVLGNLLTSLEDRGVADAALLGTSWH